MKITRITLWKTPLKSHVTYTMAEGKVCDLVDSIILRLDTDEGISGWGEVLPIPHYLPAYGDGVIPAITDMARVILGADPLGGDAIMTRLDHHLKGHEYAKSPVNIACWDITAKKANLPLYALLGGRQQESLPLYQSITCAEPQEMVEMALEAERQGVNHFQVKLGASGGWEVDVERLVKTREAVNSSALVYGDWNCGASALEAIRVGRAVKHLDLMLEQPCATLEECAMVKNATGLPMKIDENAANQNDILTAHRLGCINAAAIKISKFGGITACRKAREICDHLGIMMCIEDTWGSDIVTAAVIHLGLATNPARLLNVCDLSGYVAPRLDSTAPSREKGRITPNDIPGLGVNPDLDILGPPIAEIT